MCKYLWGTTSVCWLLLTLPLAAQQKDFATPIAQKAVKAIGDLDQQKKLQGFTCDVNGTAKPDENVKVEISGTWTSMGFHNFRGDLNAQVNGQAQSGIMIVSGKKAWFKDANRGKANEAPEEVFKILQADLHALRLAQQPHLLLNKRNELSNLGEFEINDKKAVGLSVKMNDLPEMQIYFAKDTGLPMKVSVRVAEPGGNEVEHFFVFDNYKQFNGLNHFTRLEFHRDNTKYFDMEISNVRFQESVEMTMFQEP